MPWCLTCCAGSGGRRFVIVVLGGGPGGGISPVLQSGLTYLYSFARYKGGETDL